MRVPRAALAVCLVLAPVAASADRIDAYVLSELKRQHIPGAWVMVRKDGKVVKRKGYGLANLEDGTPVTPETRMQTGSIGKMFTAAGILKLVQAGKLNLDDSIAPHFPDSPDWWKPITIRHLLNHTGGIPDYEGEKYSVDLHKEYTEDELVKFAQGMKPDFAPGERYSYSNTDYVLLGVLIHRLTGQFYGDYLREQIWKPSGMPTIRVISNREVIPHRAAGYDWEDGHWLNQDWVSAALDSTADGALYATPDDFIKWDEALDSAAVLPAEIQRQMWTPARLNDGWNTHYGFAWAVGDFFGHPYQGHNGAWQGFTSVYFRFPNDRLSVAVFANCSGIDPVTIARGIADRYGRVPLPENLKPIPSDPAELEAARQVVTDLMAGAQPTRRVAAHLVGLTPEYLARQKGLGDSRGALKDLQLVYHRAGTDGYAAYKATFEKTTVWIKLTLNDAGDFTSFGSA